jgi:hypothetical protein
MIATVLFPERNTCQAEYLSQYSDYDTGWTTWVRFAARQGFSLSHDVQIGPRAHSASFPIRTGVLSSELQRTGREAIRHLLQWCYVSIPQYVCKARCLIKSIGGTFALIPHQTLHLTLCLILGLPRSILREDDSFCVFCQFTRASSEIDSKVCHDLLLPN